MIRAAYLTLVAVCTSWGTIPLIASEIDLPPVAVACGRVTIAAVGLGAVLALRGGDERPAPLSYRPLACVAAGVILAVHWTAMFAGYDRAPDDMVIFVIFLAPVGIAMLAPRTLGEVVGLRTVAALALAVVGFGLITGPGRRIPAAGLAFALVGAATFVALVLLSKQLAEVYGGLRVTFIEMAVAAFVLLPIAALTTRWEGRSPSWAWLAVLGLVHTAGGTALYLGALARVPATHVAILGYLEPVGVVVFAWLVRGDVPLITTVAGGVLVIAAGAIVVVSSAEGEVAVDVPR